MTFCCEVPAPTTEPPSRDATVCYGGWPERVNVPQTARAIWCVAEKPVGRRQEDGFIATARKWQKGENECSRAGREVR